MARSTYIYVVTVDGKLKAAFTVKHELKTWLSRSGLAEYELWRCQDNPHGDAEPVPMTLP